VEFLERPPGVWAAVATAAGCLIVATTLTATRSAAAVKRGDIAIEPPVGSRENGNTTLQENFSYAKLCYVRNDPGLAVDAETIEAQAAAPIYRDKFRDGKSAFAPGEAASAPPSDHLPVDRMTGLRRRSHWPGSGVRDRPL
jgi:hypothetical protein